MKFDVTFKGIRCYSGRLSDAFEYVQQKWGSTDAAWEKGVKLTPVMTFALSR